jgi:hypothetical protein
VFVREFLVGFLYLFFVEIFLPQVNWIIHERAVLLDELLELFVSAVLSGVLFEMKPDQGASFEFDGVVFFDGEGVGGGTGPLVLDVVVVF